MITDDFYNEALERIDEGTFGNLAKIGAMIGGLTLGGASVANAGSRVPLPPRPRTMADMYVGNLGMATNVAEHAKYINLDEFLSANTNNWKDLAFSYIRRNETLGYTAKCFGITTNISHRIKVSNPLTNTLQRTRKIECYKIYKDSKKINTFGMGYNVESNRKKIIRYLEGSDWELCFDANKRPLTVAQIKKNIKLIKYIDKDMADKLTREYFDEMAVKLESLFADWNAIPPPIRIVIMDAAWNCGIGGINKFNGFKTKINEGRWVDAAKELMDSSVYGKGPYGAKHRFWRNAGLIMAYARHVAPDEYDNAMRYADKTVKQNRQILKKTKKDQTPQWYSPAKPKSQDGMDDYNSQMMDRAYWKKLLNDGGNWQFPEN